MQSIHFEDRNQARHKKKKKMLHVQYNSTASFAKNDAVNHGEHADRNPRSYTCRKTDIKTNPGVEISTIIEKMTKITYLFQFFYEIGLSLPPPPVWVLEERSVVFVFCFSSAFWVMTHLELFRPPPLRSAAAFSAARPRWWKSSLNRACELDKSPLCCPPIPLCRSWLGRLLGTTVSRRECTSSKMLSRGTVLPGVSGG